VTEAAEQTERNLDAPDAIPSALPHHRDKSVEKAMQVARRRVANSLDRTRSAPAKLLSNSIAFIMPTPRTSLDEGIRSGHSLQNPRAETI